MSVCFYLYSNRLLQGKDISIALENAVVLVTFFLLKSMEHNYRFYACTPDTTLTKPKSKYYNVSCSIECEAEKRGKKIVPK